MTALLLVALLLLPLAAIPLVMLAHSRLAAGLTAGAAMLGGIGLWLALLPTGLSGVPFVLNMPWLTAWGLDLALRFDGLVMLFVLLINGIGLLVVIYAYYYLPQSDTLRRFYATLLAFAAGMLGIVLSENILLMLLFWEITSLSSFLLIATKYREQEARIAARMALAITGGGGLALLAGLVLLGEIAGSFALTDILQCGDSIRADPRYPVMLLLFLIGAFSKSAQFPFHIWLPNAMAAPTPVSAYLHSATMVKAGIFLLARFYPALSGTDLWFFLLTTTGAVTFVYGAYVALLKHDFKGLLAFSTISHLGLITLMFGLGTAMSPVAAVFHIINHAVFKASLFMAAGIIDHECGTRDMRRINGLAKYMPITATLAILAAGGMAGVPFFNGFLSKEMFFTETVDHPGFAGLWTWLMPAVAVVGGIFSVGYSARFVHDVFFNGEPVGLSRTPHEPVRWMRLPVEVLVAIVIAVGLFPQFFVADLLVAASQAVLMLPVPPIELAVWHGFNLPLVMSMVALGGGLFWYRRRHRLFRLHERYGIGLSSPVAFERVYAGLTGGSRALLAAIDKQSLRQQLMLLLMFVLLLGVWAWQGSGGVLAGPLKTPVDPTAAFGFAALIIGLAGVVLLHEMRLAAVVFLSVTGLLVALIFVRFAAPDLALTQLSVELATIVLLLLALRFLPDPTPAAGGKPWADIALASAVGLSVAILSFAMVTRPYETISGFHSAMAKPGGGGTNIVNVILVDFRGFDTLGEIAVLAMAALGMTALLHGLRLPPVASQGRESLPVMLKMLSRPLLPLALLVAAFLFLRGHNLPGGGFVAGLIAAMAIVLHRIAHGTLAQPPSPSLPKLLGAGLLLAATTGAASWAFGYPFLTSSHGYAAIPGLHPIELASAMLFDLGIFLVVFATIQIAIGSLAHVAAPAATDGLS